MLSPALAQNPFATIPNEIIFMIARHLIPSDLNSLTLSSRDLNVILNGKLYDAALTCKYKKMTVFEWAATTGQLSAVEKLLARGADPRETTEPGGNVLDSAALHGHANIVRLLLDAGLPLSRDRGRDGTLHLAVNSLSIETVHAVLESGIDISTPGIYGNTPLHDAAYNGNVEIVRTLLDAGADVTNLNEFNLTALHSASAQGHTAVCKILVHAGVQLSARAEPSQFSAFLVACELGHAETVQYLIEEYNKAGLDIGEVNYNDQTGLHMAVRRGHEPVAKILLENGMAPLVGHDHNTPLYIAVSKGYSSCLKLFLDHGIDVDMADDHGYTLLHRAACMGQRGTLTLLLERGANPRKTSPLGEIPLHVAAEFGNEIVVKTLLAYNSDINARDELLQTPLYLAVTSESQLICRTLVSMGANIAKSDIKRWTPLHGAVYRRNMSIVKLLLEGLKQQGGSVSPRTDVEGTPLHIAVVQCQPHLIDLLLSFGADPHRLDGFGRSAIDWAYLHQASWDVMKKYYDYQPTEHTIATARVKRTIAGLVAVLRDSSNKTPADQALYVLGKCLVYADDLDEARTAFEQFRSCQRWTHSCDLCRELIRTNDQQLFVKCSDIAICSACADKYQNGSVQFHCCQVHELVHVPPTPEEYRSPSKVNERGESLQEWLTQVQVSHGIRPK